MKLSELSYREYIALEALPAIIAATSTGQHHPGTGYSDTEFGTSVDDRICFDAFRMADAFMRVASRESGLSSHEMDRQIRRAEAAEATVELLRFNAKGQIVPQIALDQIWKLLGVSDQASAVEVLRQMKFVVPFSTAPLGRETADD